MVKEVLSYYVDTTGVSEDMFILSVQKSRNKNPQDLNYKEWLALESFDLLKSQGITLADCLEFKTISKQLKKTKNGIYVSDLWKSEIAKEIESEITNGTILVEVSDFINSEFDFLSSDIDYVKLENKGKKINLLNTFDFDIENRFLLNSLPAKLRNAILENKDIFININPYLEDNSDLNSLIEEMKMYGYNKKHLSSIVYKCLFRLIRLQDEYNLTHLKIGFYGPTSFFIDEKYKDFYSYFRKHFDFNRGICFDPKAIGVKSKEEFLGYTIWETKRFIRGRSVVLTEKVQHTEDTILRREKRLMRGKGVSLYEWCNRGTKKSSDEDVEVPVLMNINTFSETKVKRNSSVLGYMLASQNMLRMLKKVGITNLPMGEYLEITEDNFWQCVASYAARTCLEEKVGLDAIMLVSPDMSIDGYTNWLADALILMLFNSSSMVISYRNQGLRVDNRLFPLSKNDIRKFIIDETILKDLEERESINDFILEKLKEVEQDLSVEAMELYIFGKNKLKESLKGLERAKVGYRNNLSAWDASLYQVRGMRTIFTSKEEENYLYLLNKLKDKLYDGIYTYGFITGQQD